jgi:glutamyl/glutaminyl-tRNA synthetase
MPIRTRFAPSPTGYLHIGGVRTALFNWLLTKRLGGQFVLRIDDTDAERNRPEALQPILDGFRWLGIHWDEGPEVGGPLGPYFQSQRIELHKDAALKLIESGHAYPCYQSKESLDAERKEAEKAKRNYVHRGQHRATPAAECQKLYDEKPTTVRLKVPDGQTIAIDDAIRGRVEWQSDLMGDPVILRADGRALYNFATVVDDVALQITHVVRAAEHLTNTAIQVVVYNAMGVPLPTFAHVPVVNEPNSKKKLSKRDMKKFVTTEIRDKLKAVGWTEAEIDSRDDLNPATVAFYREMGYLPAALVNYLGRLGWSLDDKTEVMSLETMIGNFTLDRVNDSPASFDPEKLHWMAGEYMKQLPLADRVAGVIPFLQRAKLIPAELDDALRDKVTRVVAACGDRIKIFSDILQVGPFFFRDPAYDAALVQKRLKKPGMPELVREYLQTIEAGEFDHQSLEAAARTFCQAKGIKIGDLNHALRVATTGVMVGPGVFDILAVLGREETTRRVTMAIA